MHVADVMIRNPICCTPSCTAQLAASLMEQVDYGIIPVLEKFGRQLVGVVTDRDLCMRVLGQGRDPSRTPVAECMTVHPFCCRADDDPYQVTSLITEYSLRGVVVVNDKGELEGLVSAAALADRLATVSKELWAALNQFYEEDLARKGITLENFLAGGNETLRSGEPVTTHDSAEQSSAGLHAAFERARV